MESGIKKQYLGEPEKKPRIRNKRNGPFLMQWRNEDDTSENMNPLYMNRGKVHLGFGKGYVVRGWKVWFCIGRCGYAKAAQGEPIHGVVTYSSSTSCNPYELHSIVGEGSGDTCEPYIRGIESTVVAKYSREADGEGRNSSCLFLIITRWNNEKVQVLVVSGVRRLSLQ